MQTHTRVGLALALLGMLVLAAAARTDTVPRSRFGFQTQVMSGDAPADTQGDGPSLHTSSFISTIFKILKSKFFRHLFGGLISKIVDHFKSIIQFVIRRATDLGIAAANAIAQLLANHGKVAKIFGFLTGHIAQLLFNTLCKNLEVPEAQLVLCTVAGELNLHDMAEKTAADVRTHLSTLGTKPPVIIVPGVLSTGLAASWTAGSKAGLACHKDQVRSLPAWIDAKYLLSQSCLKAILSLEYDEDAKLFVPSAGISVSGIHGIKGIEGIGYVNGHQLKLFSYLKRLTDLFKMVGYSTHNLVAWTYDWRLGTTQLAQGAELDSFKTFVEDLYSANNNTKVYIVGHSTGGVLGAAMLDAAGSKWATEHVAGLVTLAAPALGSTRLLEAALTGKGIGAKVAGINLIKDSVVRATARTFPGVLEFAPATEFHGATGKPVPVGQTGSEVFTYKNISALWEAAGVSNVAAAYQTVSGALTGIKGSGVPVWCLFGTHIKTTVGMVFDGQVGTSPKMLTGFGDGVTPNASLRGCSNWGTDSTPAMLIPYKDSTSAGLVSGNRALFDVARIIGGLKPAASSTTAKPSGKSM